MIVFGNRSLAVEVAEICGGDMIYFSNDLKLPAGCQYIFAFADAKLKRESVKLIPHLIPVKVIHPRAYIAPSSIIGQGTFIASFASISTNVKIGKHCIINMNVSIGHDAIIKDFCTINPGARISGNVTVKEGTLIGSNTFIHQGVTVGRDCRIDAMQHIKTDLPDKRLVMDGRIVKLSK